MSRRRGHRDWRDRVVKPPSTDGNAPKSGAPTPETAAGGETAKPVTPPVKEAVGTPQSATGQAAGASGPGAAASAPNKPEPTKPMSNPIPASVPPSPNPRPEPGKPAGAATPSFAGSDTAKAGAPIQAAKPVSTTGEVPKSPVPGVAPASVAMAKPEMGRTDPSKPELSRSEATKAETIKSDPSKGDSAKPVESKPDLAKPDLAKPDLAKPNPAKPVEAKPDLAKPSEAKSEAGKSEPPKPGIGPGSQAGTPPSGAVTDGPIIDLKAKRIPDPAEAGKAGAAAGAGASMAASNKPEPAKSAAPRVEPTGAAPVPSSARGAGFGSMAAASILGGVIGAGLLFAVERAGMLGANDDARLATLASRDAVAALDKRVAANESALRPLPDAVKAAEASAKQALDKAGSGVPAASGEAPAAPAAGVPAELVARLDSLDQRVSALQEEPGRDQSGDARLAVAQAGGDPKQVAALDERLKVLEGKEATPPAGGSDLAPKLAALQGEIETRTKANAEADTTLAQRLDALQQALDSRVKAATEAVQSATQASERAVEAGRTQVQEAAKAVDRRLQEQGEKIAALDKSVAQRADAATVQSALKVVTADRISTALGTGAPFAEPLATLRKLETGDARRIDALAPFAEQGAPTVPALAAEFRALSERLSASRKAAQAKEVAATGDIKSRFLSMAESIVQVRKVDSPAAVEAAEGEPVAKVQAALDRGALRDAVQAFDSLPEAVKAEASAFGGRLKARAAAAQASQALLSDAFKGLSPSPAVR